MSEPAYDLIAIDLDGTLLGPAGAIAETDADAVRGAIGAGAHVVIASARPPRSVRRFYHQLGLTTPQINYNGALIHDPATGDHWRHMPLAVDVARAAIAAARSAHPEVVVDLEILDRGLTDAPHPTLRTGTAREMPHDVVAPIEQLLTEPVTKLMFHAEELKLPGVRLAVESAVGSAVTITTSDTTLLQVLEPCVNKAAAVALVAERLGVARERVMAIGDAPNDAAMLAWAGLGVAVGNAWAEARAAADAMVAGHDAGGVAEAISRWAM